MATSLERRNVFTVEDLAGLSDANIHILPDGQRLRSQAQAFIESNGDNKKTRELEASNRATREEVDALKKQMAALTKRAAK